MGFGWKCHWSTKFLVWSWLFGFNLLVDVPVEHAVVTGVGVVVGVWWRQLQSDEGHHLVLVAHLSDLEHWRGICRQSHRLV